MRSKTSRQAVSSSGSGLASCAAVGALTTSEQAQVTLVDTGPWNMAPGGDFTTNYEDGIHPNAAGKTLMTNEFLSVVFSVGGGIRRLASGLMLGL